MSSAAVTEQQAVPVLEFVAPIAGFPDRRRFVLVGLDDDGLLYALRSTDDAGLRFLVVPPAPFFPDYAPVVHQHALTLLGDPGVADLLVLLVVTAQDDPGAATANLLAPIVVDRRSLRAVQVVLTEDLPLRAPLRPS
jgi:flagellar assembly factor FliW